MRIVFFTKGDKSIPSSRYRAYYLSEALSRMGHETSVIPVVEYSITAFFYYARTLLSLPKGSVVCFQRTIYNKYFFLAALLYRVTGGTYIFDIDDAIYEHSPLKTIILVRLAMFVTCGSEYVRDWVLRYNKRAYVLENGLPLSIYTMRSGEPTGVPIIGWIGTGPVQYKNLRIVPPILRVLSDMGVKFRFRLIGAVGDKRLYNLFAGIPEVEIIDALNWSDPREAAREIQKFTIGIMPLSMDAWSHAKHFKALEYMACGVPVVTSPGKALISIFANANCGLVASTEEEWIRHILRLLSDPVLRKSEGEKGRRAVERWYSPETIAGRFLNYTGIAF